MAHEVHSANRSVTFLIAVVFAAYVLLSAIRAVTTIDRCDGVGDGGKYWRAVPPGWVCRGR